MGYHIPGLRKRGDRHEDAFREVREELQEASLKFGAFNSAHEGYAVMLEEVEELWDEIKVKQSLRSKEQIRCEAKQVAAMAIRIMIDCT